MPLARLSLHPLALRGLDLHLPQACFLGLYRPHLSPALFLSLALFLFLAIALAWGVFGLEGADNSVCPTRVPDTSLEPDR